MKMCFTAVGFCDVAELSGVGGEVGEASKGQKQCIQQELMLIPT